MLPKPTTLCMLLNLLKDTREVYIYIYIGIYSDNTLLATQLLNSLKRFPEPLCMHGVVNLSSTEGVNQEHVTVFSDIGASSEFRAWSKKQTRNSVLGPQSLQGFSTSKLGIPSLVQEASSEFRAWSAVFAVRKAVNSNLLNAISSAQPSQLTPHCPPRLPRRFLPFYKVVQ